jgi:site-specific recombinase XerD
MTRATFTVLFYIKRTKKLQDGTVPIYVRITVNGERSEWSIQKSIEELQWNKKKGCAQGYSKDAREINSQLDLVKANLILKKREIEESGKHLSALELRNRYLGFDDDSRTILDVFREHNRKCKSLENKDYAPGTVQRYTTTYDHLKDFIKSKYKKEDMSLNDIKPMFISDFEDYLKITRNCCHNTTVKYIKNFKKIVRIANANGWMKSDPFSNIKYHLDDVDMDFLTEVELDALQKKEFDFDRLQQVKDTYLFCCFTGLAFVDVKSLVYSDIEEKNGKLWIKKRRQKTKNWCHIPILAPALNIMNKYRTHPLCYKKGLVLPVLSNQKMNAYLKEIADLTGIKKHLSTHTARHTFATTVTLANQVSIEVVSKMLGHSSINMTKKYARVVDDLINKDMQKIYGKYDVNVAS